MAQIRLPYHKSMLQVEIEDFQLAGILASQAEAYHPQNSPAELVEMALDHPIGSPALEELVRGKRNMVLVTSDHTRPVPSRVTLPILLRRIRQANPEIAVTLLIATGCHRGSTKEELLEKFGAAIVEQEQIVVHDCLEESSLIKVGTLPSGGDLVLNKLVVETELLVAEGFIEPHFFAGFSGGRKAILPGVASAVTVLANHCSEFIDSEYARTGILENNPIHQDMLYAAQAVNLAFILNVVINSEKQIIKAFAGHREEAHLAGCDFVRNLSQVDKLPADIVLTTNGGYPLDQNVYQTVKSMTAAEATCKEGGVIIVLAACNDGHGGEEFLRALTACGSPQALLEQVRKVGRNQTRPDQWQFQILARILEKYTVIMVTDMCDPDMIRQMKLGYAPTVEEALRQAYQLTGRQAKVTVIPDGVSVIVG